VRRPDLTNGPFIGDEDWMQLRLEAWKSPPAEPSG
jgi:hypothetical protein